MKKLAALVVMFGMMVVAAAAQVSVAPPETSEATAAESNIGISDATAGQAGIQTEASPPREATGEQPVKVWVTPISTPVAEPGLPDELDERFGPDWRRRRQDSVAIGQNQQVPYDRAVADLVTIMGNAELEGIAKDFVTVFGNARVGKNAIVEGDAVCPFGNLVIESGAVVYGDAVCPFGTLTIREGARVRKDAICIFGSVHDPGAGIEGDTVSALPRGEFGVPFEKVRFFAPRYSLGWRVLFRVFAFLKTLLLSFLVLALMPRVVGRVKSQLLRNPFISGCVGAGGLVAFLPLFLILLITCIGIILVPVAYWLAWFIGMVAVYQWLGYKVRVAIRGNSQRPFWDVTIGVLAITLVGLVPVVGLLIRFLLGLAAFGAFILTKCGTQQGIGLENQSTPIPPVAE